MNVALATELVCVLRYKSHFYTASGKGSKLAAQEFWEHAQEEQDHADRLAERIAQLGGEPNMNPDTLLDRSHSDYHSGGSTQDKLEEDLTADELRSPVIGKLSRISAIRIQPPGVCLKIC